MALNFDLKMIIRKATLKDSEFIAQYLLLALKDIIFQFIGEQDHDKAKNLLLYFITNENNQYSFQNCWVVEEGNEIIAAVNLYDGAMLRELREPVIKYIKAHLDLDLNVEDETQPGEYYIDSLGVNPNQQGKGIGSKLLKFLIDEYVNKNKQTLGLLVDEENTNAKKLYLKLGFKHVGNKIYVGKNMAHLQIKL